MKGEGGCNADFIMGGKGGLTKCTKEMQYTREKGKCKDYMSNWLHLAFFFFFSFFLAGKLKKTNFLNPFLKAPLLSTDCIYSQQIAGLCHTKGMGTYAEVRESIRRECLAHTFALR